MSPLRGCIVMISSRRRAQNWIDTWTPWWTYRRGNADSSRADWQASGAWGHRHRLSG